MRMFTLLLISACLFISPVIAQDAQTENYPDFFHGPYTLMPDEIAFVKLWGVATYLEYGGKGMIWHKAVKRLVKFLDNDANISDKILDTMVREIIRSDEHPAPEKYLSRPFNESMKQAKEYDKIADAINQLMAEVAIEDHKDGRQPRRRFYPGNYLPSSLLASEGHGIAQEAVMRHWYNRNHKK